MSKQKIIYFYPNWAPYVDKDIEILSVKYRIIKFRFEPSQSWLIPFKFFIELGFCLFHLNSKYIVCQFAGFHSLIPFIIGKIFKKNNVVILGGSDCACFPEINYGNYRKILLGWFTKKSIQMADVISPVHEKMIDYEYNYWEIKNKEQGFLNYCKPVTGKIITIYNGFETNYFTILNENKQRNFFSIIHYSRNEVYFLKGIDMIEKVALKFPQHTFTIIGVENEFMGNIKPTNVIYKPFVSKEELREFINSTLFYLQLSISEGFPNALCEAMLCGCIPIVSNVSSMPDIVDGCGFVLNRRDEDELAKLIEKVLTLNNYKQLSLKARNKVTENYSFNLRKEKLINLFDKM